jgi:transcriptional regulator with XRE-family HTH domain
MLRTADASATVRREGRAGAPRTSRNDRLIGNTRRARTLLPIVGDKSAGKRPVIAADHHGAMRRFNTAATKRALKQAETIGGEILTARASLGLSRLQVSRSAGVSPDTLRRVESGDPGTQLDTLCAVGTAVGIDVVVHGYPGRPLTLRDSGQLDLAKGLCAIAHSSWRPELEVPAGLHGEAADLGFFGPDEILDCEIDRLILDLQGQHRRNTLKRDYLDAQHQRPVRLVMVVEDTARNRAVLAPHLEFLKTLLPAGSRDVLNSLRSGRPLGRDGLLWLRRRQPPRR